MVSIGLFVIHRVSVKNITRIQFIYIWEITTNRLYIVRVKLYSHLVDFFCFLEDAPVFFSVFSNSFVWALSFLFLSCFLWWPGHSPLTAPEDTDGKEDTSSRAGSSVVLPGTLVFLQTTLAWNSSGVVREMGCCALARVGWTGQGKTSQRKCMCAGTWAIVWGWETEESETTTVWKGGGLEAGGHGPWDSLFSGREEVMSGWVAFCENSGGWELCCCYTWKRKWLYKYGKDTKLQYAVK